MKQFIDLITKALEAKGHYTVHSFFTYSTSTIILGAYSDNNFFVASNNIYKNKVDIEYFNSFLDADESYSKAVLQCFSIEKLEAVINEF